MTSPGNLHMDRAGHFIAHMDLPPQLDGEDTRLRAAWTVAAGAKIARHTRARALVRNKLIVEVADKVWQQQLSTLRHFLIRNLAKELGVGTVTEIDFRPMPARREPQRAVSARPSREGITDPVLSLIYERSRKRAQ